MTWFKYEPTPHVCQQCDHPLSQHDDQGACTNRRPVGEYVARCACKGGPETQCTCGYPGLTYDGSDPACPVHGKYPLPTTASLLDEGPSDLATRIARLARECRDHPWPLPKPSCPECARNAGITAAARLARGDG